MIPISANSDYASSNSTTANLPPLNSAFSISNFPVTLSSNFDSAVNFSDSVFSNSALSNPVYTTSAAFTPIGYDDAVLQNCSQISGAEAKLAKDDPRLAPSI